MADLPDRAAWLAAVARCLDAMPDTEAEVLEELAAHLDDRVAEAVAVGLEPAEAERRARNRLGDPASLGRSIRKAKRSRKSALALVGGSAVALGAGTAIGAVAGFIALYLAWTAASVADFAIAHGSGWSPPAVYAALAAVAVGLSLAARVVPGFVAAQVRWPFSTVRRVGAALILVPGLAIALLLPNQDLDGWLALLYPAIPVAAAIIALTAPRTGARGAWKPAAAIVLGSIVLMPIAWPYPADRPLGVPAANLATIGQVADFGEGLSPPAGVSAGESLDAQGQRVFEQSFSDLHGWHDFTDELWPLERAAGGWRFAATPMLTVPYDAAGLSIRARYEDPRPRVPVWYVRLQRATSAGGVRMIFPDAFQADRTRPWNGSVLEWWLGR